MGDAGPRRRAEVPIERSISCPASVSGERTQQLAWFHYGAIVFRDEGGGGLKVPSRYTGDRRCDQGTQQGFTTTLAHVFTREQQQVYVVEHTVPDAAGEADIRGRWLGGWRAGERYQEKAAAEKGARAACLRVGTEEVALSGPGARVETAQEYKATAEAGVVAEIRQAANLIRMVGVTTGEVL